jgi:hypothetical protein
MGAEEGGSRRGRILPIGHEDGMLERRLCGKRTRYAIAIGGKGPAGGAGIVPPSLTTSRSSWGGQEDSRGRKTALPPGPRRRRGVQGTMGHRRCGGFLPRGGEADGTRPPLYSKVVESRYSLSFRLWRKNDRRPRRRAFVCGDTRGRRNNAVGEAGFRTPPFEPTVTSR